MKLFRFGPEVGVPITMFGSRGAVLSRILRTSGDARIGCMHIDPGGVIGYHQASADQLFLVVGGEGWVRGGGVERRSIESGIAAFWRGGEWHESGAGTGMTAIVIEAETLDPAKFLLEL